MKKKILFSAYNLDLGGIEKALINLLKYFDSDEYDITLVLEKKEGVFLNEVPSYVKVEEYRISSSSNVLIRKVMNRLKLWHFYLKNKNRYDFAGSFCTTSIPGAHIALIASKNNAIWLHGNYYEMYDHDEIKLRQFLNRFLIRKFKHHIYVSEENRREITAHYPELKNSAIVCYNIIDGEEILRKANEPISLKHPEVPLFINVGRQEEYQKRLTRIISSAVLLKKEGYSFQIWMIGDGPDQEFYRKLVKENNLEEEIIFLGRKKNPFPYYGICDAVLLSSRYEGFPVVFQEAMIMRRPIITTQVSDYELVMDGYGIVTSEDIEGVYQGMKDFLDHSYKIQKNFDYVSFNQKQYEVLKALINGVAYEV